MQCYLSLLADLPVSQFLLIAIINGGTQWACVCMGAAIVPQEIFEFVTIKIFKKSPKICMKPINFNSENAKKFLGVSLPRGT